MTPAKDQDLNAWREAGAAVIAARARAIAREHGIGIEKCVWDTGEDVTHEYAHRLDLSTKTSTVRLYLCDLELTAWNCEMRRKRTEHRLQSAISQLLPRSPEPTYSYR